MLQSIFLKIHKHLFFNDSDTGNLLKPMFNKSLVYNKDFCTINIWIKYYDILGSL